MGLKGFGKSLGKGIKKGAKEIEKGGKKIEKAAESAAKTGEGIGEKAAGTAFDVFKKGSKTASQLAPGQILGDATGANMILPIMVGSAALVVVLLIAR